MANLDISCLSAASYTHKNKVLFLVNILRRIGIHDEMINSDPKILY